MCMFSGPVETVAKTNIFARRENNTQFLAYQMSYSSPAPVAMILPVPMDPREKLEFIDLSGYRDFFDHMRQAFPRVAARGFYKSALSFDPELDRSTLVVHQVGDFEASFVPQFMDFERLDPRFRIAPEILEALNYGAGFSFAVFQLRERSEPTKVHPMAFKFPTRLADPDIFFPTVHVHDGQIHEYEKFDHSLYYQGRPRRQAGRRSVDDFSRYVNVDKTNGIVAPTFAYLLDVRGNHPNKDIIL